MPHKQGVQNYKNGFYRIGRGPVRDQLPLVSERRHRCGRSAPPHGTSSFGKRISQDQPSG